MKEEMDKFKIIVVYFNIPLSRITRTSSYKDRKDTDNWNKC